MQLKILADENIDYRIVKRLRKNGFKVISIMEDYKGISDKEVLNLTRKNHAVLLTENSTFGEWVFAFKEKTLGVIFLRYHPDDIEQITDRLIDVLNKYKEKLFNKFVVITVKKIRIREI